MFIDGTWFNLTTITHTHDERVSSQELCSACIVETHIYRTTGEAVEL